MRGTDLDAARQTSVIFFRDFSYVSENMQNLSVFLVSEKTTHCVNRRIEEVSHQYKTRTYVRGIGPTYAEENTVYRFRNLCPSCRLRASNIKEPGDLPR